MIFVSIVKGVKKVVDNTPSAPKANQFMAIIYKLVYFIIKFILINREDLYLKKEKFATKLNDLRKKDGIYLLVGFCLLLILLLLITTTFYEGDYTLQLPIKTLYGTVSWGITIVFGLAGIILLKNVDRKQMDLAKAFLILVIPLGILYCAVTPLGRVPDEEFHARKAMAISQGNFFSHANKNGDATDLMNAKLNEVVTRSADSYAEAIERMITPETEDMVELGYTTMALYAPICHMPQAFGMFVARLFGATIPVQCYVARLANLAVSIFLIFKAIKFMPFKKHILLFLALLPITLQEISSMAADGLTIAISIFYISYILYLKYDKNQKEIKQKEITILAISSVIVSLCKIVYLPLCLLLFVLPKEKFKSSKNKILMTSSIFTFSVVLNLIWLRYCSRFLVVFNYGVNTPEQIKYVLTHPISYLLILFRSNNIFFEMVVAGLCGESLGLFDVQASVLFVMPSILLFGMLFLVKEEKEKIKFDLSTKMIFLFIFIIIVLLIYTSLYVQWTSLKNPMIYGLQPRYFLPILLLMTVILDNHKIIYREKLSKRYMLLFMLCFNLQTLTVAFFSYLNGFINYYIK